ncbi:MAG: hypothetical protein WC707_06875 [Candidatus Babeliaceae bacterium]|jgi:hypothetical protein
MNYFENCTTLDEAKTRRNELAKLHHPDHGGDNKVMQEIMQQYFAFFANFGKQNNTDPIEIKIDMDEALSFFENAFGEKFAKTAVGIIIENPELVDSVSKGVKVLLAKYTKPATAKTIGVIANVGMRIFNDIHKNKQNK